MCDRLEPAPAGPAPDRQRGHRPGRARLKETPSHWQCALSTGTFADVLSLRVDLTGVVSRVPSTRRGVQHHSAHPGAGRCRHPTTWTILQHDGPDHLGLWYNALPEHHMALITSGCAPAAPASSRPRGPEIAKRSARKGGALKTNDNDDLACTPLQSSALSFVSKVLTPRAGPAGPACFHRTSRCLRPRRSR